MAQWMDVTIQSVNDTTSYREVMCRAWYNSDAGIDDSSNDFSTSGDFPGNVSDVSKDIDIPFNGGSQKVHEKTLRVYKQYGQTTDVYFAAWLSGINYYNGAEVYDNTTYEVPGRPYAQPSAPTGVQVTRSMGGLGALVRWIRQASTAGRYQNQYVQRRVNGGSWSTIHTITADYTSTGNHTYEDAPISASNSYEYRVRAHNSTGTATSGTSNMIYATPTSPNNAAVSRNSDSSHTVSWSRRASTAGRYQNQYVQRRVNTGSWSGWATIHTITTDYTNTGSHTWTDTTTRADRGYQYRIQAQNSTGTATSTATAIAHTTPAPPSSVAATKLSNGDIRVRINPNQTISVVEFRIQHQANGGTWSSLATVAGSRSTTDYTHSSPDPADTHRYRVATAVDYPSGEGDGLVSGYEYSSVVQLSAPPDAPTGLGPSSTWDAEDGQSRTLHWTHTPVDSSDQTAFDLRYRFVGDSAWLVTTGKTTDGVSEYILGSLSAGANQEDGIEWQVRTWGEHADPSPWSATALFQLSARPTVSIDVPAESQVLPDATVTTSWTYYQEDGAPQAQWRATLLDNAGETLEVNTGSGVTAETTFETRVLDDTAYAVRLEVASSVGLWSTPVVVQFSIGYPMPALVDATVQWHRESGTVALTLIAQGWDDIETIEPVAVTVERAVDGGEAWEIVARALPLGGGETSLVDTTVPTRADVLYRVTSISALPSMAVAEPVAISIDERTYAYLGYGPGFASILVFYGNLSLSSTAARAQVVEHFAGRVGADNRPGGVIVSGEARTRDIGVSASLLLADGMATTADFEEAALEGGVMCLRGPEGTAGRRTFGMMHGLSASSEYAPLEGVQFTVSETGRG